MTHDESKNWKAPALTSPADLQCGAKGIGTVAKNPPQKVTLSVEKATIDARISHTISDQPFDGTVKLTSAAAY